MDWNAVAVCVLIFFARLVDVSLDTLRLTAVVRSKRLFAWCLGFVQVLIWIFAVSFVVGNLDKPWYAITYALGFATGNFLGITIEGWLAHGEQLIRVFTREGHLLAHRLRGHGYGVTVVEASGRDGALQILYLEAKRRKIPEIARLARSMDPSCFYFVEDIRHVSDPGQPTSSAALEETAGETRSGQVIPPAPLEAAMSGADGKR